MPKPGYDQDANVRISPGIHEEAKRRADDAGMTVKGYVEWVLMRAFKEPVQGLKALPK